MKTFSTTDACARFAALARRPAQGRVHSVFERAVNLEARGRLVCLLSAGAPPHPYSAVLAETADFKALGLAPGQPAAFGGAALGGAGGHPGGVVVGGAARLAVSLQGAAVHNLSVAHLARIEHSARGEHSGHNAPGLCPPAHGPQKLGALAGAIVESHAATLGLAPMLSLLLPGHFPELPSNHWCDFLLPRASELPALLGACATAEAAEPTALARLKRAGRSLAGCGPGLTPSSDDFLVGLCAALWAAHAAGLRPAGRQAARALAQGARRATGVISAEALYHAEQGLFSRDVLRLLAAIFSPDSAPSLPEAAARVAAFGSASGTDTLAGLWLGLYCIIQ